MPALGMRTGVYSPCDSYVILKENYQPLLLNIFDLKLVVVNLALVQTIRVGGGGGILERTNPESRLRVRRQFYESSILIYITTENNSPLIS